MIIFSIYLLIINAAGWLIMLIDKQKAIRHEYRISEATLMSVAMAGGSLGCYLGMMMFRHKTRKPLFSIGLPIILSIHIVLCIILLPIII